MNFWSLLRVDAPADARLQGLSVAFRGVTSPWACAGLLVLLALVSGLIVLLYWRERGRARPWLRIAMAGMRLLVVNLVGLLLLLPIVVLDFEGQRPRPLCLLIDNSASMSQRDQRLAPQDKLRVAIAENLTAPDLPLSEGSSLADVPAPTSVDPARSYLVRKVLENDRLRLLEALAKKLPLSVHFFGNRLHAAGGEGATWIEEYRADEPRTALADAIRELATKREGDPPAAIVVFTDGRDNASQASLRDVAQECAHVEAPLHVYGVGASAVGNLQLKELSVPDALFYDDVVAVTVRWRCQGFKDGMATVAITLGGKTLASKRVAVREGDEFRESLSFVPKKDELQGAQGELTATIKYDGMETFLDDNEQKRAVRLVDRKVRVLYVEGAPRWEYKFLMTALLRDRRVDPRVVLIEASPEATAGTPYLPSFPVQRADLFAYDLVILGDVPSSYFSPERLTWLRDFVREGGGLAMIAGRKHAPVTYYESVLAEVLPVEFMPTRFPADVARRSEPFVPQLTPLGGRSEMMALVDGMEENRKTWKELPGFVWHYPVTKLRAGAWALLTHPTAKAGDQPMPVLAMQHYGKGLVLFLGSDETWRWRYNAQDRYFGRFWGQVVYQMGLPHLVGQQKRIQLTLDRNDVSLGRPSYVYARILDAEYRPWNAAQVGGRLEALDAKDSPEPLAFDALPGQPGEYRALLGNNAVGRFRIVLDEPEGVNLEYRVSLPPQHELAVAGMDEEGLRAAAALSGGKFYREEDLYHLADDVQPRYGTFAERRQILPWHPLTLLLIVGLVAGEWLLRKFADLS